MDTQNKKYLAISQHWSGKKGQQKDGQIVYVNPVSDEGKRKLTHIKDLEVLIEFWGWGNSGVYYKFTDSNQAPWGNELYEIFADGTLGFIGADYDSSD